MTIDDSGRIKTNAAPTISEVKIDGQKDNKDIVIKDGRFPIISWEFTDSDSDDIRKLNIKISRWGGGRSHR